MTSTSAVEVSPALGRFVRGTTPAAEPSEKCDFCNESIQSRHRHLLAVADRQILCVCQACSILFDKTEASLGKHRLIPDRRLHLEDFRMSDAQWDELRIPVGMAFFFHNTPAARVSAFFPGPAGSTESMLRFETWNALVEANPLLATLQPDVEALLVNRARGARQYYLVPIDECFKLVALIRTTWRGLSGGQNVWNRIDEFFESLRANSKRLGKGEQL